MIKINIISGDCKEVLKNFQENSIDLIVTSPPYADRRENTYGGIKKLVEFNSGKGEKNIK